MAKIGRNDPCPCGSGKKYKNCCMGTERDPALQQATAQETVDALPQDMRAMERQTAKLGAYMNRMAAEHPEQMDQVIDSPESLDSIPDPEPTTPLERAQDLIYQAFETSGAARVRLAREALKISPDCADAYVILAEELANSPKEALAWYDKGIAAGKRALGRRFFREYEGEFWHMLETRPFMRAMLGKVEVLAALSRHEDSIELAEEMLRLNPGDNQGVRYLLMRELLLSGDDEGAQDVIREYPDEDSAIWNYSEALIKFRREGGNLFAMRTLFRAYQANRFVPQYLLGYKDLPLQPPAYYGFGDDAEAAWYAMEQIRCWRETPGALEWLKSATKALHDTEDPRTLDGTRTIIPDASGPIFFLNQSIYARYTRCPECDEPTRQRVRHLTVMLEPNLVTILRQECRYCPACDLLIAHADEVEGGLTWAVRNSHPEAIGNDYVVLGYVDTKEMRKRPDGPLDPQWAQEHTIAFREHRQYEAPYESWYEAAKDLLGDDDADVADDGFDFAELDRAFDVVHQLPASSSRAAKNKPS